MSTSSINTLVTSLPDPLAIYKKREVSFEFYVAKNFFSNDWEAKSLRELTKIARRTYQRYGDVPIFDEYDNKAAVYLVRSIYSLPGLANSNTSVEEWLGVRLIPAHGDPVSTEDLDVSFYSNKNVTEHIRKKFFKNDEDVLHHVITTSRLCGISPFLSDTGKKLTGVIVPRKQLYSAGSFAVIQKMFLEKNLSENLGYRYITSLFHEQFINKVLGTKVGGKHVKLNFLLAHELLNYDPKEFKLDRSKLSYQYPGYFLDIKQLLKLLQKLLDKEIINTDTLRHYLKIEHDLDDLIKKAGSSVGDLIYELRLLGNLLTVEGGIKGSCFAGEALRKIVDEEVDDLPNLYIMPVDYWRGEVNKVLSQLGIEKVL